MTNIEAWDESYACMDGIGATGSTPQSTITAMNKLIDETNKIYLQRDRHRWDWPQTRSNLLDMLKRTDLNAGDVDRFAFWDSEKPYTRNLVYSNDSFSLLILCWSPGKESKIHNHPSDGCFIKTLRGCIRESKYDIDEHSSLIVPTATKFLSEGQVSWMDDTIGLHKV